MSERIGATRTGRAPKEEGDERRHVGKSRGGEHDTGPGGGKAEHRVPSGRGGNPRGKAHGRTRGSGDRSAGQRSGDR